MKTLTINTLVALSMALLMTPSMAATGELSPLPVSSAEQRDRHSVTAATAPVPLYALTRLDAQSLAAQAMTDQELKAVEGGWLITGASMRPVTTTSTTTSLFVPKGTVFKEVVIHSTP